MTDLPTFPDLSGTSVFITGGGSGIGAALTQGFLTQGARVAFVQRRDGSAFCDDMQAKTGHRPLFLPCDITDTAALHAAIAQAGAQHGPITTLVNNAADDERRATLDVTPDFWRKSIDVNLTAYFFAAQAVIPGMRAAGGGAIINYSSISYMMADVGYPAYMAANAAIVGLTRTLAREFGPDRIRVNAIAPGWVLTQKQIDMWVTPQALAAHVARQCLKDTIDPADLVGGTLFLASRASRMMTAQTMVIDAGVVVTG